MGERKEEKGKEDQIEMKKEEEGQENGERRKGVKGGGWKHSISIPTFSVASLSAFASASSSSSCCMSPFSFFTVAFSSFRSPARDPVWELTSADWE